MSLLLNIHGNEALSLDEYSIFCVILGPLGIECYLIKFYSLSIKNIRKIAITPRLACWKYLLEIAK